ncbi:hypothetical protein JCM9140_1306 [Halalkalibacter wakoensis JCM 9140]|uniref:Intracellular proteinase inhibitor BsuPI domain-containing protein n=2 Tax=Halalkalibacter wakoensis TaxID=127891 RepID=W4Q1R6_9BACI|nr:hypothetical protein JCM9140_1306 [Halalkalibacter wakoensis JCM 9140]
MMLFCLLTIVTACGGPSVAIEVDPEQTRIIHEEQIDMISVFVRLENNGQIPANDLTARFLIHEPTIESAVGGSEIVFTDHEHTPEIFQVNANSSFFFAEVFSLETDVTNELLSGSFTVQIMDRQGEIIADYLIEQVTNE